MALTYATLQTQVADFVNRDDLTAQIPTFITLAEAAINRDVRHWQMEKRSEATFNQRYEPLPLDWISSIRVSVSGNKQVKRLSQSRMLSMRKGSADTAGEPRYYTISASQIELFPTPIGDYDGSMIYYAEVDALSDTTQSNWLLASAPDVYLYGALLHTAPYLQEDARLAVWASLYKEAVNTLNANSMRDQYGGAGLAIR